MRYPRPTRSACPIKPAKTESGIFWGAWLQVIEQWNSANGAIFYGKDAELTGADREDQEISMLAFHLLQSALVLVNTRLVDRVLEEPGWAARMDTPTNRRALTPLFWSNVGLSISVHGWTSPHYLSNAGLGTGSR